MNPLRIAVYTAIIGNYDDIKPAGPENDDVEYLCFVDSVPARGVSAWTFVCTPEVAPTRDARTRLARDIKIRPHVWLPGYDVWIWLDATHTLVESPSNLVALALREHDLATFRHPLEFVHDELTIDGCVYQEGQACIYFGLDEREVIEAQMSRYRQAGYPSHNGLVESSLIVRRNSERTRAFCDAWWAELCAGSRRDQLSFNYTAWQCGFTYACLPGTRRNNRFATYLTHLHRRST